MKQGKLFNILIAVMIILIITMSNVSAGIPSNPSIAYNSTETVTPKPLVYLNTSGGSFTTLILNATQQDYKWKAYVGNVSGKLSLADQDNYAVYDWDMSTISGNVFASRNDSIDWSNLTCANRTSILDEDDALNINSSLIDSINRTFNDTAHKQFYAASNLISAGQCPAISTYVNGTAQTNGQTNLFQEILLEDSKNNLIYSTILEDTLHGFDNNYYDFQMIVAEDETLQVSSTYYFYLELI